MKDWREIPFLSRLLVRAASPLVPIRWRDEWVREWRGELLGQWMTMRNRGEKGIRTWLDLNWRALGSFVDAWRFDEGGWNMEGTWTDLIQGFRSLNRRPGFSLVVILTVAVGIGFNTAIFSLAHDVLLRPYPYPRPYEVVVVVGSSKDSPGIGGNVSYPNVADLAGAASSVVGMAAIRWWTPALAVEGEAVVLRAGTVTANFFQILGVEPGQGRFFLSEEEGEGRPPRVVLSHGLWMNRFGSDPGILGRTIQLNGMGYEVIGVTRADFEDPGIMGRPGRQPQLWRTVASPPTEWPRSGRSWRAVARVRAGTPLAVAQEEVSTIMAGLAEAYPEHNAGRQVDLVPLRERIAGPSRPVVLTLLASVGLLLLVACANLANLFLGRALDRQKDFAIQRALGASGWRLGRRAMVEAALFAVVGGGLGILLAVGLVRVLAAFGPLVLPRPTSPDLDGSILAFSAVLTLTTGFLVGLFPAHQAVRSHGLSPGREETRSHTGGRRSRRLQRGLVVGEVAMTVVLIVGAGLLLRSFQRLGGVDLGLRTDGVMTMELHGGSWWDLEPAAAVALWDEVLSAVRGVPGVQDAGAMDYVPLGGSYSCDGVGRADRPPPEPGEGRCAETRSIFPGALDALDIPLVRGRRLSTGDAVDAPPVVVIDASMAEEFWPGEDPLGKPLYVHTRVHEVVGIVEDIRHFGPNGAQRPTIYIPAPQEGWSGAARGLALVVRADGEVTGLVRAIRTAVWGVNPGIAFGEVETLEGLLDANLTGPRFRSFLLLAFGLTGILMATLGIGGVMAYSVARRVREMGIRMAVGAAPTEVRSMVVREGLALTSIGLVLGLAAAASLGRFVDALLFEVSSRDPVVFVAAPLILAAAAVVACVAPAWRASRVDVSVALSSD